MLIVLHQLMVWAQRYTNEIYTIESIFLHLLAEPYGLTKKNGVLVRWKRWQ